MGKFSVTVQMLKAASDVKNLEDRHELIKVSTVYGVVTSSCLT